MIHRLLYGGTFACAVGCALVAGLLFAFSVGVMPALSRLPAPQGITAMQAVNVAILNPVFGIAFFGTTLASAALAISAPFTWDQPGAVYRLTGGLLFVLGAFVVTAACNVPLNDALAAADPNSSAGATLWAHYQSSWTAWNNVRTVAGVGAAAALVRALL